MIFRLSNKLKDRIKVGSLETSPPHEHPLMDWSAHLFFVGDRPYILVSNTKLAEGGVTHRVVGTRLNETLLSALAPSKSDGYGEPREAFKTLLTSL